MNRSTRNPVLLSLAAALLGACAGEERSPDALPATGAQTAEIAVHIDETAGGATVRVLAWRASLRGVDRAEAMGVVDPLAALAPDNGCEIHDVARTASAIAARGGTIDLQEMSGIEIRLGEDAGVLRPSPRLFPEVAASVGGVVAEAGPFTLSELPSQMGFGTIDGASSDTLSVADAPKLGSVNGVQPSAGAALDCSGGLFASVTDGRGSTFEVRPYGSTQALACPISEQGTVSIPRAVLTTLVGSNRPFAATLETVRRTRSRMALVEGMARVQIEVRSAIAMELRP